jgi:hypothetical protein
MYPTMNSQDFYTIKYFENENAYVEDISLGCYLSPFSHTCTFSNNKFQNFTQIFALIH